MTVPRQTALQNFDSGKVISSQLLETQYDDKNKRSRKVIYLDEYSSGTW